MKTIKIFAPLAVVLIAGLAFAQNVLNYKDQGGARWAVGGTLEFEGTGSINSDVTVSPEESATFGAPDQLFATPANANQVIGLPKLNVTQLGATLATGDTLAEGINPLAGTCAPITAGTEAAGTVFITGTASYKYTGAATAAANDGFDCDVTGPTVGNGTDSIGLSSK